MNARYDVSLVEGSVHRDGQRVRLSKRELGVVLYLAGNAGARRSEEMVDALWPQRCKGDTTVLRVCVLRVRARLGDASVIVASAGWYRLGDVRVDLHELEHLVRPAFHYPLDPQVRAELERALEMLTCEPTAAARGDWFVPIAQRIAELRRETQIALARDALERNDANAAFVVLARLIAFDPCDESARELLIKAYLARGDRASALREYRVYRDALAAELGVEPAIAFQSLLASA